MSNRDYVQAIPWLRQLAAEAPGDRAVQVQLGKALEQTGDAADALQHLAPALAAGYPDEKGALHALEARVLRELGRDAEADKGCGRGAAVVRCLPGQQQGPTQVRSRMRISRRTLLGAAPALAAGGFAPSWLRRAAAEVVPARRQFRW